MYVPPGVDHEPREDGRMNACPTYANGSVGAVVKVDLETCAVDVLEYVVAHDCGTLINPVIVEGQIHGGVAQGIGGALLEELPYDENGVPLATTFMDYLLPAATEVPPIDVTHFESPSPFTALGVKGAGEAGVIGVAEVVAGAVEDALGRAGRRIEEIEATPITPASLWRRLASAGAPSGSV
jgi:carbon-monoxide dehydrogenase large subunit